MKIEDPKKNLQRDLVFNNGDTMKMKFKFHRIESSEYGNLEKISGEIPLLFKYGEYPNCPFYNLEETKQHEILKSFHSHILNLDPNLDDEQVYKTSLTNIITTLCYMPSLEPETEDFTYFVNLVGSLVFGDDKIDNEEFMNEVDHFNLLNKTFQAGCAGQKGDLEQFSKLSLLLPPLEKSINAITAFLRKEESKSKASLMNYHWCFSEILDYMISQIILFSNKNGNTTYNDQTWNLICGINKGLGLQLEFLSAYQGANVPEVVRQSFPFVQMKHCFYSINSGLNDIRGLIRDIELDQVADSSILSKIRDHEDFDLRTAFYSVYESVQQNYKMIQSHMSFLEATFPNDPNLHKYIYIIKVMLDGQAYGYFSSYAGKRYGEGIDSLITKENI